MGAPKVKTIGGGTARPVADRFNTFLMNQMNNGTLGNLMSGQNNPSPLSFNTQVDANNPRFAATQEMLNQQQAQNQAQLNERFAGAGARGSGAQFANASFMAQAAPQNVLAMQQIADQMQMQNRADLVAQGQYDLGRMGIDQNRLNTMMGAYQQAQGLGTPQAQTVMQPSGFSQVAGAVGALAPFAMAPFTGGASLGIPRMMPDLNFFRGIGGLMTGQGFSGFRNAPPPAQPNTTMNPNWGMSPPPGMLPSFNPQQSPLQPMQSPFRDP